jgi:hypothetical protein
MGELILDMTLEQQAQLKAYRETLPGMTVDQLFGAFHGARLAREAGNDDAAYWRAVMIAVGEQLHRRLGFGAMQDYARRYG